jgi:hypothetical protein
MELNNREIAVMAWMLAIFLFVMVRWPDVRRSLVGVLAVALGPKLAIPLLLFALYFIGVVFVASRVGMWGVPLLKDTLVWFCIAGLALFGKSLQTGKPRFTRRTLLATIALPEIVAFTLGLVSFALIVEFALLPFVTVLALLSAVAALNREHANVKSVVDWALAMIGVTLLGLTLWQLVSDLPGIDWEHVALTFYLPICLTAAALPFVYALGRYAQWEQNRIRDRWRKSKGESVR